jgi:Cytochrome C and Quinol oxidase polypeptide I/Thiamine pyrophosphate enzyme, C-terminal TPP binding domain
MLGRLSWAAIPFDQPIVMVASGVVAAVLAAILVLVTVKGWWPYLWREWITSVHPKRIGVIYMILGLVMLLRGFSDAIMMRSQQALAVAGAAGYPPPEHYDQIFSAHGTIMATMAICVLSFMVWLHHFFTMGAGADVNGFFGIATMIIAVPTGVKLFNWMFTLYGGKIRFDVPIYWTLGFMVTFVIGGMTGVMLAIPPVDFILHNSLFLIAHFHNTAIGGVVFGAMAGYTYWFPKAFGFKLNEPLGKAAFWCWLIGFYLAFMPLYALGLMGATRRMQHYSDPEWQPFMLVALAGAVFILIGIMLTVVQLVVSVRTRHHNRDLTGDPWNGRTLEWSIPSPPPAWNFALLPQVERTDAFSAAKQGTAVLRGAGSSKTYKAQAARAVPGYKGMIPGQYLASLIDRFASDDALFTGDDGTALVWLLRLVRANGRRRMFGSLLHGTMATGVAAAIGLQKAQPGRQVIAMAGDGGFSMLLGEVLTTIQENVPIKIVVFDNGKLGFVELEQKGEGLLPVFTNLKNPDFGKVAAAMGLWGRTVTDASDLETAVQEWLAEPGPAVLNVKVAPMELVMPPFISAESAYGMALYSVKAVLHGKGGDVFENGHRELSEMTGMFERVRRARSMVHFVRDRIPRYGPLLTDDLHQFRSELVAATVGTGVSAVAGLIFACFLSLAVIVTAWDGSHRLLVTWFVCVIWAVLAVAGLSYARRAVVTAPHSLR